MTDYLKRAKTFELAGGLMGYLWIVCNVGSLVQLVRGFFNHSQWLFMIAWIAGAYICKSVAKDYGATAQQFIRDGLESGQIVIDENNQAVAAPAKP